MRGIYSYLWVVAHEEGHRYYRNTPDPTDTSHSIDADNGPMDSDHDGLSDAWEIAHNLNPNRQDTCKISTPDSGETSGDEQILAEIFAYGKMKGSNSAVGWVPGIANIGGFLAAGWRDTAWKFDWADDGVNYGAASPTVPFPWIYGSNLPDPPTNALWGFLPAH